MTSRTWPWMKSIRRGRERVRDRERPGPSENQATVVRASQVISAWLNLKWRYPQHVLPSICFLLLLYDCLRESLRPWLHETGTNSDRYDFRSVSIQMLVSVYIRPVWKTNSCRFHSFRLLNRHEWLGPVWSRTTEPCKHELIWDQSKITVLSMRMSVFRPFQDGGKQERV